MLTFIAISFLSIVITCLAFALMAESENILTMRANDGNPRMESIGLASAWCEATGMRKGSCKQGIRRARFAYARSFGGLDFASLSYLDASWGAPRVMAPKPMSKAAMGRARARIVKAKASIERRYQGGLSLNELCGL